MIKKRAVKNIGALASIGVLLTMMLMAFVVPELSVSDKDYLILLSMISAFLGMDMILENRSTMVRVLSAMVQGIEEEQDNDD